MYKDRSVICKVISQMLDNPDENGIFPTSTAYVALEHYIEGARREAIAQTHIEICDMMDKPGADPRLEDIGVLYKLVSGELDTVDSPELQPKGGYLIPKKLKPELEKYLTDMAHLIEWY